MKLDVSSSGALAASLDRCIVSYRTTQELEIKTKNFPQKRACFRHPCPRHGDTMHALCRVLVFWKCGHRHIRPLWPRESDLHI